MLVARIRISRVLARPLGGARIWFGCGFANFWPAPWYTVIRHVTRHTHL